jgi:4a-hydroxytetrahydrobiopterin dehydratase
MVNLADIKCIPCQGGEPPLLEDEIDAFYPQVSEWKVVERNGIKRLERTFKFNNFAQALVFTNKVGQLAEREGHHPAILTEWGKVTVTWWTHKINGLHQNDFAMAAKTDRLAQE